MLRYALRVLLLVLVRDRHLLLILPARTVVEGPPLLLLVYRIIDLKLNDVLILVLHTPVYLRTRSHFRLIFPQAPKADGRAAPFLLHGPQILLRLDILLVTCYYLAGVV